MLGLQDNETKHFENYNSVFFKGTILKPVLVEDDL